MNPVISVIVPIFNVEDYVEETVLSILKNKSQNIEIILVDDSSTDNTKEILKRLSDLDDRIRAFYLSSNQGVSHARNVGIREADGDFVLFVDGDDQLVPGTLDKIINHIEENSDLDIIKYDIKTVPVNGETLTLKEKKYGFTLTPYGIYTGEQAVKELFNDRLLHTSVSYVVRKKLIIQYELFYPLNRIYGEDFATVYKWLFLSQKILILNEQLYLYVQRKSSVTHRPIFKQAADNLKTVLEIEQFFNEHKPEMLHISNVYVIPRLITAYAIVTKSSDASHLEKKKLQTVIRSMLLDKYTMISADKKLIKKIRLMNRLKIYAIKFGLYEALIKVKY